MDLRYIESPISHEYSHDVKLSSLIASLNDGLKQVAIGKLKLLYHRSLCGPNKASCNIWMVVKGIKEHY